MYTADRTGVILRPKQPFVDWANSVGPRDARLTLDELRRDPTVYLVPDLVATPEYEALVRDYCTNLAADWFESCTDDVGKWPKRMSWEVFLDWFDWEVFGVVVDAGKPPIRRFTLDEEE